MSLNCISKLDRFNSFSYQIDLIDRIDNSKHQIMSRPLLFGCYLKITQYFRAIITYFAVI